MRRRLIVFNFLLLGFIEFFLAYFSSASEHVIATLQGWGHALGVEHEAWTVSEALGPQPRFVTMLVIIFLSKDGEECARWLLLRFFGSYLRWLLGMFLQEPRPCWLTDNVEMLHCPLSYGLPSGHAVLFGSFSLSLCWTRGARWRLPLGVWYLAMCIGRLYLGTHSIHDVLFGTTVGISLVYIVHDAKFVPALQRFFHDQGFWFVVILLCFGVSSSIGFAEILREGRDVQSIAEYTARARSNKCPAPILFDSTEGIVAVSALGGLLVSLSLGRFKLESFLPKRALALLVYFIPSLWRAETKAFLADLGFPYHSTAFVLGACNLVPVFLLFTANGKEEQEREHARLLSQQTTTRYGALPRVVGGDGGV